MSWFDSLQNIVGQLPTLIDSSRLKRLEGSIVNELYKTMGCMRCSLNAGLVHISKLITLHTIFGVWMSLLLPTCVNLLASLGING